MFGSVLNELEKEIIAIQKRENYVAPFGIASREPFKLIFRN